MAVQLPVDVQEAFRQVVYEFGGGERNGGGVPAIAGRMGIAPHVLYNKANPADTHHNKPTLADGVVASVISNDPRIAQAFCHVLGGVFVRLPDLSDQPSDALLLLLAGIGTEEGDFYRAVHQALERDFSINPAEYDRIDAEAHQLIAAILEALLRMKEMAGKS